jgi:heptose I phosphotransferase
MSGETLWQRWTRGTVRLWQRPDWATFAGTDWAKTVMTADVTDRYHAKQGRSTGRLILHADGRRLAVYLKRHYRLAWWRGLLAAMWPEVGWSPAAEEWQHLAWARDHGMPVPASVAAGEFIGPWGRLQSVLAIEELADMLPLHEAIPAASAALAAPEFQIWKTAIVIELARLTRSLHQRRRFHKDLYLCHFYLPRADTERAHPGPLHVIDLHRLGHHPWTWRFWQVKDLAQLLYSSEIAGVSARDRLRFWHLYFGEKRHSPAARWLRWAVSWKWQRYRRHNAKRRPMRLAEAGDA